MKTFKFLIGKIDRNCNSNMKFFVALTLLTTAYLIEDGHCRPNFLSGQGYGLHPAFASILYPVANTLRGAWEHYIRIKNIIRDKYFVNEGTMPGAPNTMGTFSYVQHKKKTLKTFDADNYKYFSLFSFSFLSDRPTGFLTYVQTFRQFIPINNFVSFIFRRLIAPILPARGNHLE